jgi:4-nitrophenyl phosphatase
MSAQPSLIDLKALVIDMDGVLWRGETPMPGLKQFFTFIAEQNIAFTLATDNARKTQEQYVQTLGRFGVTIPPEVVMTSSLASAEYLKTQFPTGSRIHVIGQDGIRQAIVEAGYEIANNEVEAVVVGLDFELTYNKLKTATVLINNGARFIGTNPDLTFPFEDGVAPGNGAILAALTAATGQQPEIVGKPGAIMFDLALNRMGTDGDHTAMIGDRLETDIMGGQQAGLKTILVLSGISQADELPTSPIKPDWVFPDIDDLIKTWQNQLSA